jgi:hypothetical protein
MCAPGKIGTHRFGNIAGRNPGLEFPTVVVMRRVVALVMFVVHEKYLVFQAIKRFMFPFCPADPRDRDDAH